MFSSHLIIFVLFLFHFLLLPFVILFSILWIPALFLCNNSLPPYHRSPPTLLSTMQKVCFTQVRDRRSNLPAVDNCDCPVMQRVPRPQFNPIICAPGELGIDGFKWRLRWFGLYQKKNCVLAFIEIRGRRKKGSRQLNSKASRTSRTEFGLQMCSRAFFSVYEYQQGRHPYAACAIMILLKLIMYTKFLFLAISTCVWPTDGRPHPLLEKRARI